MAKAPRKATTAENLQATLNNPNVRKFLDMLSQVEGTTAHGYNTTFGGGRIESLANHPNIQREFKQTDGSTNSSGAAGRYQFLDKPWRHLQKQYPQQMPDFGERSQDFGAVALIAGRGALQDVVNGRFGTAVSKVGNIWASLPTSPYKQPKKSWDEVNKALGLQVPAGGAKAANAQALTPEQGKRLYDMYKAGRMSPEQRADYERDFATVQKPAGAKLLGGGSGGGGSAPKPAAVTQPAATPAAGAAPYVLPVEIIMAYNDGSMNPQQRADFERDYKAGVIAAPRHIPFELKGEQPKQGYLGRVGDSLSNLGSAMGKEGGGGSMLGLAEGVAALGTGLASQVIGGLAGGADLLTGGLTGRTGADAAATVKLAQDTMTYQPRLATGQASLGVMNTAVGEPFLAAQEGLGGAVYSTTGGALQLAQRAGLPISQQTIDETAARNAALTEGGFAALTTVLNPATPIRAVNNAVRGRPAAPVMPPPINATPVAPTATPFSTPAPAATARPAPRPQAPAAPLAANPADLAAQAEAMPRPVREPTVKEAPPTATSHTPIANREKGHKAKVVDEDGGVTYELSRDNVTYHYVIEDGRAVGIKITHDGKSGNARVQTTDLRTGEVEQNTSYRAAEGFSPVQILSQNTAGSLFDLLRDGHYKRNPAELTAAERGALADNVEAAHKTNRARLDAQAEAMRAEWAAEGRTTPRPATTLTPENPTITIQPDGGASRPPAGVANPVLDGTYISSRTGKPYESAEAAQNGLAAGRLEATHEVSAIDGGYGLTPKRSNTPPATPIQAPAGTVTTVGEGGLNVMHGSTRADLTADQVKIINPASKQGKKGRVYGGFYTTPDAVVAERYANMGAEGSTPTIYDVQIKQGAQVLNKEGDITRLSESYINEQRAAGVDVIAGKDPRGQVEYAIINPEAVVALTPRAKPAAPKTAQGKAFTTSNKPVAFEYDVVPIESVVKSTNADLTPNTAARPELQPRNRDTDASTAQINKIANELNPELLAESPTFSMGAPVVLGSDAVAGHGRLAAIERRYGQGAGAEYRAFVAQKAAELGIDPARLAGVERPVLVRRVKDEADALTIAQDSNAPTTLRMSPAEQARLDAPNLPDLDKLARGADGEMNIPASYDFVRDFMGKLPVAERGDLMTADGRISQAAVRRIQAAVAEKAYKDPDLIARFTESMGDEGKRISAALQKQAGAVAALAEAAAKGERYPTTLGADLAQAANKYADIKAAGSTVREYLDQGQLVDDGLSTGAREALEVMGENAKSGRAIGEYIQGKIAEVEAKGNPMQDSLFQSGKAFSAADLARKIESKNEGVSLRLSGGKNGYPLSVDRIFTEPSMRGQGSAKKAMADLLKETDRLGINVSLSPSAEFGAQKSRLTDFYKSLGFIENKGRNKDYEISDAMYRRAKPDQTLFQSSRAQKEAEAVRRQYEGTPEWMQAPNGKPTKLGERQWVQVRTPSFKEWFGDWENNPKGASKVVDENGEPLVVYHGSNTKGLSEFDKNYIGSEYGQDKQGFFFTDDVKEATSYAQNTSYGSKRDAADFGDVIPSFLSIKSPHIQKIDFDPIDTWDNNYQSILEKANGKSSDGVLIKAQKFQSMYVAFEPTQIKSATGNSGAFDGANPNIYMQANKPQAAAIGERIAEQVKAAGRSADEAKQAGKLAEAYYAATAKALGLTPDEVFAQVGLSVERGNVGGANAALRLGEREHSMVFGENANASSFVHEAGHHFLESHAKLADQSPKLQADVDAVMTWAGHDGRAWSDLTASQKREVHEKFAESFEQYLLTGKAPTKGLKGVFADFKAWLTDVYTSLTEFAATNPRADLSPEVMAVMDRMLGGGKAEKAANAARGKNRKKSAPITPELLDFKRSAPVSGGVSPALHQSRYDVLRDIGLTDGQIRGGSVEGDLKRLEWDAELAKYDTEYGVKMKEQLELERQKLREYGDGVVESMGGTAKATPETRGAAIVRPLEAYQAWYRDKIKAFYKQADEQGAMTGGIELRGLEAKLKENSAFYNDALLSMRKSLKSFMFEQRLLDDRGNPKPMSAKQAEMVRKHLNSIRTFETSRVIGELNTLIDDAVFSTLNRSVYGEARAVNTQYHRIFSDPKGIATLLKVDGINRTISHEKVAANVAALAETDAAQFRHIMKQLESMPTPELQKMANQAIGEIRAQIAEKITAYDSTKPDTVAAIGKALAPYRGDKLREIFGEKGAQKLETFVAAHGILRRVDAQPSGTASMLRNIATKGSEVGMTGMGTAAGGAMAGPAGAAAGAVIGQQIGAKIKGAIAQAVDKKSFGKAMSPRQLETMRQSYDASGRRLAALPETEAATAAAQAAPDSTRARVTNSRLERSKEWIAFYAKLTDEQKAAAKKLGAAAWLLSVGGSGDNQASDDGENR